MSAILAATLTICAPGPRDNCVVDGDTIWLNGEKIRLANIDAPDMPGQGRCTPQKIAQLANTRNTSWCDASLYLRSRDALHRFLNAGPIALHRTGRLDRNRRTLATLSVNGRDAGAYLISLGLARPWR